MFAMSSTTEYPATAAGGQCTSHAQRMPASGSRMSAPTQRGTWAAAGAKATPIFLQTGVVASVSLFVLLLILSILLLASLLGLPGLPGLGELVNLSCLTGLVMSLVGLLKGLSPGATTGD